MRLKKFNDLKRANETKILAYEISWLLKLKPLQIKESNDIKYAFCNERFTLSQIMFWIRKGGINGDKAFIKEKDLKAFSDKVLYHLKYEDCNPKILELMLVSFTAGRDYKRFLLENAKI